MGQERAELTDWIERMAKAELAWIDDNLGAFQKLASEEYAEAGRGVILTETYAVTSGGGEPYWYLTQAEIEEEDEEEIVQAVREYDPASELVLVIKKSDDTLSVHRVSTKNSENLSTAT